MAPDFVRNTVNRRPFRPFVIHLAGIPCPPLFGGQGVPQGSSFDAGVPHGVPTAQR